MEKCKEDVIEKVKKLLNLADKSKNSNDSEAQEALLKAQKLMAEYDISIESTTVEVIVYATEITKNRDSWTYRIPLAQIIAENFRCKVWLQNGNAAFMGHSMDARIAREAYEYAYDFVLKEGTKLYNKYYTMGRHTKGVFNSYAQGFIIGLKNSFDIQCKALMIVTPKDVEDKFNEMSAKFETRQSKMQNAPINPAAYAAGVTDGKTIMNGRRIKD